MIHWVVTFYKLLGPVNQERDSQPHLCKALFTPRPGSNKAKRRCPSKPSPDNFTQRDPLSCWGREVSRPVLWMDFTFATGSTFIPTQTPPDQQAQTEAKGFAVLFAFSKCPFLLKQQQQQTHLLIKWFRFGQGEDIGGFFFKCLADRN